MRENYDYSITKLLKHEGGYTNHPDDPGGPTNFGITIFDYRLYINKNGTPADVKNMTVVEAKDIYKHKYWDEMRCDQLPSGVDYAVFDFGVNSGVSRSAKYLQAILKVDQDGKIGPLTLAAAKGVAPKFIINQLCNRRMAFLRALSTFRVFGKGWTRRVTECRADALKIA